MKRKKGNRMTAREKGFGGEKNKGEMTGDGQ